MESILCLCGTERKHLSRCYTNVVYSRSIDLTQNDLYIPSLTFPYGIYKLTLEIQFKDHLNIQSYKSIYISN